MSGFKVSILHFFGLLGDYLSVLFTSAIQQEMKIVLPLATKYIAKIANDPTLLTGAEKRAVAISQIVGELGQGQSAIGSSIINLAIELAYQKFKVE
jgi:hypothetical protein